MFSSAEKDTGKFQGGITYALLLQKQKIQDTYGFGGGAVGHRYYSIPHHKCFFSDKQLYKYGDNACTKDGDIGIR